MANGGGAVCNGVVQCVMGVCSGVVQCAVGADGP